MSITSVFQVILSFHEAKNKLTNFKSRFLSRAVFVHFANKRAHLHGVLVLMVKAVSLKETKTITRFVTLHNRLPYSLRVGIVLHNVIDVNSLEIM